MKNSTQTSTPLESRITDVTVYLSGAQVTRKCAVPAEKGVQRYVFEKLPSGLLPESIQVSAGEGVIVRSVEHAVNYLQAADYSEEIKKLQKKLDDLTDDRLAETNKIDLGLLEENLFTENKKLAGMETGLKSDELKATVLFYNERMAAIRKTRIASNKKIKELDREISFIKNQLGGYSNTRREPVSEITVTVVAEGDVKGKEITLSYFVYDANWRPSYDIRAKDVSSNVALHYKAKVFQRSGENWEEVKLTLSTSNPRLGGACPQLNPWYIDFYQPPKPSQYQSFNVSPSVRRKEAAADEVVMCEQPCAFEPEEMKAAAPAVVVTESVTSVEYNITAPYTIISGDGGQDVEITVHSLPAKYRYYSVRKLEREVFLLAAVSEWEHLNLIAGEASIFFENRYVGKTVIDPRRAEEKIDLSLGVDKSVVVTRVRGKDFTEKSSMGNNVKLTRQWELTARNLKAVPIEIELMDQIPVSVNKQITVDAADISGAELAKETGLLTWKLTLKPTESKSMNVKYVVTHPKNMIVYLE